MKEKVHGKRAFARIALFISAVMLTALTFHSCQKDLDMMNVEEIGLKNGAVSEIILNYPQEAVTAGGDFTISFSSTCGRIMIERGFTAEVNELGEIINKVYKDLSCDTENLLWEAVGLDEYEDCQGGMITENIEDPGTYVYRAKLNFKAKNKTECPDCEAFYGNQYECFMITVAAGNLNEGTFTDARDGHVYKWIKIGDQIWMAENLAYNMEGSYDFNGDANKLAAYGRLYNHNQVTGGVAPAGWHVPSMEEWGTLISYIEANPGLYGNAAKSLASKTLWNVSYYPPNTPGNSPEFNNSSGFNGLPAGTYESFPGGYISETYRACWWSSDAGSVFGPVPNSISLIFNQSVVLKGYYSIVDGLSVRCVKNAE